jgi:hypothetical protein
MTTGKMKYQVGDIIYYKGAFNPKWRKLYVIHSVDLKKNFAYITIGGNSKYSTSLNIDQSLLVGVIPIICGEMDKQ